MSPILLLLLALSFPDDTRSYEFVRPAELDDFQVERGSWAVQAGALQCSSKGSDDSLLWRRNAAAIQRIEWQIASSGRCELLLSAGKAPPLSIGVQRGEGTLEVRSEDRLLRRVFFEVRGRDPARVRLLLGEDLRVQVGDDVAVSVGVDPRQRPQLRIQSHETQSRFPRLEIVRGEESLNPRLEDRGLRIDDALERSRQGRGTEALDLLEPLIELARIAGPASPTWPSDLRQTLQTLAVRDPALRHRSPLADLTARFKVTSRDTSVTLATPLSDGWTTELYPGRRVDGPVLAVRHETHQIEVLIRRYDQQFEYWFGEDPRVQLVGGGDNEALARARLADLRVEWTGAQVVSEVERHKAWMGDLDAYGWRMNYERAPGSRPAGPRQRHELYARFRGDTYRWSEDGPAEALALHADDLAWIRTSLALQPRLQTR